MTTPRRVALLSLLLAATGMTGCATNAATFYEGTRFALAGEYNPASGQPVNLSLGYKRRISAIVPPQEGAPAATTANPNPTHSGEALSLVSLFDVGPGGPNFGDGVIIKSTFASGMAARDLTNTPNAAANIQGLFAKETLPLLSRAAAARKEALFKELRSRKITEPQAAQILQAAGLRAAPPAGCPPSEEALCTLQRALSETDEATLQRLESASTQVIFAPAK
jgi:hypothetical protein